MQLPDKSGISCDKCCMNCSHDFVYYSADFKEVNIYGNRKPSLDDIIRSHVIKSIDICTHCFDIIQKTIINNFSSNASKRLYCEITGCSLNDVQLYYYCVVTKVDVRISNQPSVCVTCKYSFHGGQNCPKCSSSKLIKRAVVVPYDRYLEFSLSSSSYDSLVSKRSNDWTTNSEIKDL